MGNLKRTDFIIALTIGCVIALLCFQFQSTKKSNRSSYKKEIQQITISSQQSSHDLKNISSFNSKYLKKRKPALQNRAPSSLAEVEEYEDYGYGDGGVNLENEFSSEEAKAQLDYDMSLKMEGKIENYLITQVGLPANEIAIILEAKRQMDDEILRNKNNLSNANLNGEINTELKFINQKVLSNYQEVLKQILGPENYQRYTIWQDEQDAGLTESYASGNHREIDEI